MTDFNDICQILGSEAVKAQIANAVWPEPEDGLKAYNIAAFLRLKIPPRENILAPILQEQSLSMIFAARGIGKTHIALGLAYAIASGSEFMCWQAPKARRVLYLDGEMSASAMQDRLKRAEEQSALKAEPENFVLITPDMQSTGMPDIATEDGQVALAPYTDMADFIVVDNISTLCRTGKENEAEGWLPIQGWALQMRRQGKSVLFVHHAGKGGQQRGTSRREDVLDLVMELRRPEDYRTEEGARFKVHFVKARHLSGHDAKPFEAQLGTDGWSYRNIEALDLAKVVGLKTEGLSLRKIADETGLSKSTVDRLLKNHPEKH